MTEKIDYTSEQIKQIQTLKGALEASLKNWTITSEEAKWLESKFLDEKRQISLNARREWCILSKELREKFQEKIEAWKDWKIWPWTMDALKFLASKSIIIPELWQPTQIWLRPSDNIISNNNEIAENNSHINEDELYKWLKLVTDINNWNNKTFDIKDKDIQEKIDNIDPIRKKEAQKLLDISKNIDWVNSWKIIFTESWIVALELDTRWSNLYIQSLKDNYLVTWQAEWKFFTENIFQADFKKFVENYDSENTKRILTEIWFIWWFTFLWVMAFLVRTWIWLMIPTAVSVWLWAYRWYELYKMYNLSTNDTVSIWKKYRDNPEFLKKYLFLSELWYLIWNSWDNFTSIDGDNLSTKEVENKYKEIKWNEVLEKKYSLLSKLNVWWYNPKFIKEENRYELDFYWFFDSSSVSFDKDNVYLKTDTFNDWKEKKYDITKDDIFKDITNINQIIRLNSEKKMKENDPNNNNPALSNQDEIAKIWTSIKELEKSLI